MTASQQLSIVLEWENVPSVADGRVGQVLAALSSQSDELATAIEQGRFPLPLMMPLELLVLFNPAAAPAEGVKEVVDGALAGCATIRVHYVPALECDYFKMKNLGARQAQGDLVICLDGDVIPEPGWLATLVGAFVDPGVHAVASRALVRPDSLYSRTVALTWLFGPPPQTSELRPAANFHANGAAFRRPIILAHPYPDTPGQSRGAGWDLFLELSAAGIIVYEHTGARLDHPPPQGLWRYCRRALVHGSDDWHSIRRRKGIRGAQLGRSVERVCKKWLTALGSLWRNGPQVGLSRCAWPAAAVLVSLYFSCYFLGDVLARLHKPASQGGQAGRSAIRLFGCRSQATAADDLCARVRRSEQEQEEGPEAGELITLPFAPRGDVETSAPRRRKAA